MTLKSRPDCPGSSRSMVSRTLLSTSMIVAGPKAIAETEASC
eukprot:CAMPEP_0119071486 /NCGR_PEP_ID=MMETSP1178-20130426/50848_1 /TAXON_ID=33656 /ORGANISM="unid sp, Strain CCMP2000" /LENGTH=41 /DNA_ID= /DNA_START= /DNA_END= /DNA_ORIENTATION=